jgi:hypothetical protein
MYVYTTAWRDEYVCIYAYIHVHTTAHSYYLQQIQKCCRSSVPIKLLAAKHTYIHTYMYTQQHIHITCNKSKGVAGAASQSSCWPPYIHTYIHTYIHSTYILPATNLKVLQEQRPNQAAGRHNPHHTSSDAAVAVLQG